MEGHIYGTSHLFYFSITYKFKIITGDEYVYPLHGLALGKCLNYLTGESRYHPFDAMEDAHSTRIICEKAAKELGYGSLHDFLIETNLMRQL